MILNEHLFFPLLPDKQSCILKFSLALLSVLLTKKYILDPKLIFFLLSCSTFLVRTADTIIYKKSDFEFVLPMKIIWKNPSSKVRYFFNIIFNFHYFPGWPNDLKGKIPFLQKPLIQDFVSRLSIWSSTSIFFLLPPPIYMWLNILVLKFRFQTDQMCQ